MTSKVQEYANFLFQHGLERYDASQANNDSKGAVNPGGAKVFMHPTWRTNKSRIQFNNQALRKVLMEQQGMLYALNRIELDEEDQPVRVELADGSQGYARVASGLMFYVEAGDPKEVCKRIVEGVLKGSGIDIQDYVAVVTDLEDTTGNLQLLKEEKIRNFANDLVSLKLSNCILMNLPSGAPGSSQFWSFVNKSTESRQAMTRATTASDIETDGLPF